MTTSSEQELLSVDETRVANPQMPGQMIFSSPIINEKEKSDRVKMKELEFVGLRAGMPSWDELIGTPHFKIGIVIDSSSTYDRHISSIPKPATPCSLSFVVVLNPKENENKKHSMKRWFKIHRMESEASKVKVLWGQDGMKELLESDIDAVYIIVPPGSQREYVLESLKSGKHVLLNDPISTGMAEFIEQQTLAKKYGKFIQFSTMFVHQFQVLRFINKVLGDEEFGWIHRLDASLHLSYNDVEKVGVKLPLCPFDGSIRVLGRFCVLVSVLFFSQAESFAKTAKVDSFEMDDDGVMTKAKCTVKFSKDRVLHFDVSYTHSATRQSIKLDAASRFATMNDFVIEHPDGLATYRVYEKAPNLSEHIQVTTGEAIDLAGGPPQNTMMWRTFVNLCHSLDQRGGWDKSDMTAECRVLANVALQTKRILMALMKSAENSFEEVVVDDIDYQ